MTLEKLVYEAIERLHARHQLPDLGDTFCPDKLARRVETISVRQIGWLLDDIIDTEIETDLQAYQEKRR